MNSILRLKRKRDRHRLSAVCILAVALVVTPFLAGQKEDEAALRVKAIGLEQQGLNIEAEQIWNGIVLSNPQNAEALAHLGLLEARQEHYEVAIDYYRRALAVNQDLPGLQMNLGLALFKAAQFPDAIRMFESEFAKHPGDSRLNILLGMAHYGMKDYLVAIPYLKRATEQDPQNVTLRMTLAQSCISSVQYQCVIGVHKEILALNAESAEADMLAGEAFDQLGDTTGAIKEFRAAILKNSSQPGVHFGLGYLLWTEGNWTEAANEFRLELQNVSKHTRARIYLADSLVRQSDFSQALMELGKLTADEQSDSLVHRDLGTIYANSNRVSDAVRELEMAVLLDPVDEESHFQLAKIYELMGRRDDAGIELANARQLTSQTHEPLEQVIDSAETP